MPDVSSQAIVLRRIEYGDSDLIVSLFTLDAGKLTVIAKSAKKSKKRFPGILELFNRLAVVFTESQGKRISLLKEAALQDGFDHIRADIRKTAYAAYWVELMNLWIQEGEPQAALYKLLLEVLSALDAGEFRPEILSFYYQLKFLNSAGFTPHLDACCLCQTHCDSIQDDRLTMSLRDGGIVCCECRLAEHSSQTFRLSKGILKQLAWMEQRELSTAARVRFSEHEYKEVLDFLETFVSYHVGKVPKSLTFLKRLRRDRLKK